MSEQKRSPGNLGRGKDVRAVLAEVAERGAKGRTQRTGPILLRLTGEGGGDHYVHFAARGARVTTEAPDEPPLFEVTGDAKRIQSILEGKKEGRAQFFAGGIRVRGDLQYLSDLAYELGLIKEPF